MRRRSMLRSSLAGLFGALAMREASAATETTARQRVVYHLADADRVIFVLGNLQNHVDGVGGPGKAEIRLVVHGPALRAFHALAAEDHTVATMKKLADAGVGFDACANTTKARGASSTTSRPASWRPNRAAWCGSPSCNRKDMPICGHDREP